MSALRELMEKYPVETAIDEAATGMEKWSDPIKAAFNKVFRPRSKDDTTKEGNKNDPPVKDPTERMTIWTWMMEDLPKLKGSGVKLHHFPIKIGARYAPFFKRGHKNIEAVDVEFAKDLSEYEKLLQQATAPLEKAQRALDKVERDAEQFIKQAKNLDDDAEKAAFKKQLETWNTSFPALYAQMFKDSSHSFLGYGKNSFLEDKVKFADGRSEIDSDGDVQIPPINAATFDKLSSLVQKYTALIEKAHFLYEEMPTGIDVTDPPFKRHSQMVYEGSPNLHYTTPIFDQGNNQFLLALVNDATNTLDALAYYLYRSVDTKK